MKSVFVFVSLAFLATCQALSWSNCDRNSIIQVNNISPTGTITPSTNVSIEFTASESKSDASLKAIVDLEIEKSFGWFGYGSLPGFVWNMVGPVAASSVDGVRHVSGSQFEVGCGAASSYLKKCPPDAGSYTVSVDMAPIFKKAKDKLGSIMSWIGSGTYKGKAVVTIEQTKESLACVTLEDLHIEM